MYKGVSKTGGGHKYQHGVPRRRVGGVSTGTTRLGVITFITALVGTIVGVITRGIGVYVIRSVAVTKIAIVVVIVAHGAIVTISDVIIHGIIVNIRLGWEASVCCFTINHAVRIGDACTDAAGW